MSIIFNLILTTFICFIGTSIIVLFNYLDKECVRMPLISPLNLLFGYGLGFIILIKAVHILGVFSLFDFRYIILLLFVVMLISLIINIGLRKVYKANFFNLKYEKISKIEWFMLGIICFVIMLVFFIVLNPPRHADAMRYHLVYPKIIIETGKISFVPDWCLNVATDAELFFAFCMEVIGLSSVKPMILINAVIFLLGAYMLAKNYVDNKILALLVVFLISLSPIFFAATTIVKPDVFQLLFLILAMNSLIAFESQKKWFYAIFAAIFLGEMFALKWQAAIPLFAFVMVFFILNKPFGMNRKEGFIFLLILGCAIVILPIGWYLRNYLNTGNPIWPLFDNVFNKNNLSFLHEVANYSPAWISSSNIYQMFFMYPPALIGGFGPIILAFFIPGFLLKDFKHRNCFIIFVLVYLTFWYFTGGSFRFTIFLLPFIAITSAIAIKHFLEQKRKCLRYICIVIVALGITVQLGFANVYSGLYIKHLFGLISNDEYFATVPHYSLFQKTKEVVSRNPGRVLVILDSSETFYLNVDYISGDPKYSAIIDYSANNGEEKLRRLLKEKSIAYILLENEYLENSRKLKYFKKLIASDCDLIFQMEDKTIQNRLTGMAKQKIVSLYRFKLN